MKPKKICFLALGILLGAFTLSVAAFAAGSVKFGIKTGDKLTFAGSDEPIVWNVIQSDKTNTDDESGMLLLADNLMGTANNTTNSTSGLKAAFTACYDKEFSDLQKNTVLRVTKKDESVTLTLRYVMQFFSVRCNGALDDEALFALSYKEASSLPMATLAIGNAWWLRTVGESLYSCYTYVAGDGKLSTSTDSTSSLRPAVNLKKAAFNVHSVAGEAPLLLPAENIESSNTFTAVTNNATAWKLNVPQTDIYISSVKASVASDNSLSYDIRLNAAAGENSGLSFIIVKPDGTVSYYMRKVFDTTPQSSLAGTFAIPSDVDKENDRMYVFYERSAGKFSGEISELSEICLGHIYEVKDLLDTVHEYVCTKCGNSYTEAHDYTVSDKSADGHTMVCSVCGGVHTLAHDFKAVQIDNADEHRMVCTVCQYAGAYVEHTYAFAYEDYKNHKRYCTECGAYGYMKHNFDDYAPYEPDPTQMHTHTCADCSFSSNSRHNIVCTDLGYGEGHERACTECSYRETLAHTFDTTAYPDKHIQICGACGARYEIAHTYGEVTAADEQYHSTTCSVCGYVRKEKHNIVYTVLNDGLRHSYACTGCPYGATGELHNFVYGTDYTVSGFKTAHCACGLTGDTAAALGGPAADIAVVRDILDENSVQVTAGESTGNNGYNGYRCLLFERYGGDFSGFGEKDGDKERYVFSLSFKSTKPFACTGLWVRMGGLVYGSDPYSVILYGRENAQSGYVRIGEATLSYMGEGGGDRNATYLFTAQTGNRMYDDYKLDIISSHSNELMLGQAYLLGAPSSTVDYKLSGVVLAEEQPVTKLYPGDDFSVTLLSQDGYPAKENVSVLENGKNFAGFTYSEESGILSVDGLSVGSGKTYTVKASAPTKPVKVTAELEGLSFEGSSYAMFSTDYVAYLTDSLGGFTYLPYELTVTIGGKVFDEYEYAMWEGALSIPGAAITGDIVIKGMERGCADPKDAFFSVERDGEPTRYYDSSENFASEIDTDGAVITLFKNVESQGGIYMSGNSVVDLNGHTLVLNAEPVLNVEDTGNVTVKNGVLTIAAEDTIYIDGTLSLEKVTVGKSEDGDSSIGVIVNSGKLFLKDTVIDTPATAVMTEGFVEFTDSRISGMELLDGATGAFYSGVVGSVQYGDENAPDLFDMLAPNRALSVANATSETLDALLNKTDLAPDGGFSIVPADGILAAEPQDVLVPYPSGKTVTLSIQANGESTYRWFGPDGKIENAYDRELTVETANLASGKYRYTGYVQSGNLLVRTRTAVVSVECAHETVSEDGVCASCGLFISIEVIDANGLVRPTAILRPPLTLSKKCRVRLCGYFMIQSFRMAVSRAHTETSNCTVKISRLI